MEQKPDYYQILGVLPKSEDVVIRGAYRALMQKYHPDMVSGDADDAARRTREINEAYAVLRDPEARARYDAARLAATPEPVITVHANEPAVAPQPPNFEPARANQPPSDLASLMYKSRHALITAGYLAAVLLIFVVARAALTNRHPSAAHPKASEEIALSESPPPPHSTSANQAPAKISPPKSSPAKSTAPKSVPPVKEIATPVAPQPVPVNTASHPASTTLPAPNRDVASSSHPAVPPSPTADRERASETKQASTLAAPLPPPPSRSAATKSVERAERNVFNRRYVPYRHRPHRTAAFYASRESYVETHSADRDESDEATTKWLNDRSAISRPRWRAYKTWQRYHPQN